MKNRILNLIVPNLVQLIENLEIMKNINIKEQTVSIIRVNNEDYISITDIARHKNSKDPKDVVKNWFRNRSTIEFLGLWEKINNPNFNRVEFDPLLFEAGSNSFTLSPTKWIKATRAIGNELPRRRAQCH